MIFRAPAGLKPRNTVIAGYYEHTYRNSGYFSIGGDGEILNLFVLLGSILKAYHDMGAAAKEMKF